MFSSGLPFGLGFWLFSSLFFIFLIMSLGLPLFGSCLIGFGVLGWGGLIIIVPVITVIKVCYNRFVEMIMYIFRQCLKAELHSFFLIVWQTNINGRTRARTSVRP